MTNWQQRQDLVRNCKGAAASIILLLLMAEGRSLTAVELQRGTNYSDKPVSDALAYLEPRGIVQNNGRSHGWSLARSARQLDFIHLLTGSKDSLPPPAPSLAAGSHETAETTSHDDPEFGESSHDDSQQTAAVTDSEHGKSPNKDRNNSDLPHVCMFKHKHVSQEGFENIHDMSSPTRKNSELRNVLCLVGIKGPNLEFLTQRNGLPPSWPLAWWLDLQTQKWQAKNPAGWVFVRLKEGKPPKAHFVDEAEAYLQECNDDLTLPQLEKIDNDHCLDCGEKLNEGQCLFCSGVIER